MVRQLWRTSLLVWPLLAIVAVTSVEGNRWIRACPTDSSPVCGTDQKTYWNECIFKRHNCRNGISIAYQGACKSRCPLFCPPIYRPVCGSNGQTFWNECELRRKACGQRGKRRLSVAYRGRCSGKSRECPTVCSPWYSPVCGTNGETYWNECELNRYNCNKDVVGKSVSVDYPGRCIEETGTKRPVRNCDAVCPTVYTPVCGTDGKTYSNRCFLDLANCNKGTSVEVDYEAPCQDATTRKPPVNCDIFCATIYSPICGSDGNTYSNNCELGASNCRNGINVTVIRSGRCEDGGLGGGLDSPASATPEIQSLVDGLRSEVENLTGRRFVAYEAVSYRSQVVAGTNYFVKVRVGPGVTDFLHLRIYKPLEGQGTTSLSGWQVDKRVVDPIEYF